MFNLNDIVVVNRPLVVSETIDGEAIIMHHGSGHYFSAGGPAAVIWRSIEEGVASATILDRVIASFQVDEPAALPALGRFLETLRSHDLIRDGAEAVAWPFTPPADRAPFSEPAIEVHTDLADMLLLDPIHDVDEAGWPAPQAVAPQP